LRRAVLFATCLSLASPALAGDGRIELSQTCALAGTCTSGDTPGFPISVSAGSYVLTSNLTVSGADVTAILGNDDITIDLNGFAITGVTSCTGAPAVCTGTGSGNGINFSARATIRNGTIRRMGNRGILTGGAALIENMTIAENGGDGLTMYYGNSQGSLVQGNTFYGNGESGVQMVGGNVLDNTATYNGDEGFYMATYAGFHHNKAAENNGGNANDQVSGGVGTDNVCGTVACN
jgi:hypothetical protein